MAEHRDYRIDLHASQTAELFDRDHRLIFNVGGYNSGKTFTDAMIMLDRGTGPAAGGGSAAAEPVAASAGAGSNEEIRVEDIPF